MLEVIFRTEADRQRATTDDVFPDYVPRSIIDQIWQEKLSDFVVFIPYRQRRYAREHHYYRPVSVFFDEKIRRTI